MRKLIHRLRRHPEHVRVKILYGALLVSFFILFGLWSLSAGTSIADKKTQTAIQEDLKPFSMLKSSVIDSTKKLSWPFGNQPSTTNTTTTTNVNNNNAPISDTTTPGTTDSTNTDTTNTTNTNSSDMYITPDTNQ